MTTSPLFWTELARKYAAQPISNPDNYQDTLSRTMAHLGPQDHVLELGCGTGPTALTLSRRVARVTATDFAAGMIEIAEERLERDGAQNVTFSCQSIADACANGPFDAVAAFNLLHLVKDIDPALRAIHGALKPGGIFVQKSACLSTPVPAMWLPIQVMRLLGKAPYVRFMTRSGLERRIRSAGFEIVERHSYGRFIPSHFLVAKRL